MSDLQTPPVEEPKFHIPLKPFDCSALTFDIQCKGSKKKAHIVTRQEQTLKGDAMNILVICEAHERYFNQQHLKVWYRFVRDRYPDNFGYVMNKVKFIREQLDHYVEVGNE